MAWHGLGQEMPVGASLDAWRQSAGMDWELNRANVEFIVHGVRYAMTECLEDQSTSEQCYAQQKTDAFRTMLALYDGQGRGADFSGSRGTAWGWSMP